MNNIGICGVSSNSATAARKASGRASACSRSPIARLPIWSWFCRQITKAVGGRCPLGVPRGLPSAWAEASP